MGRVILLVSGVILGVGGHSPQNDLFPNLFACSLSKEAWISDLVEYLHQIGEAGAGIYNSVKFSGLEVGIFFFLASLFLYIEG